MIRAGEMILEDLELVSRLRIYDLTRRSEAVIGEAYTKAFGHFAKDAFVQQKLIFLSFRESYDDVAVLTL